MSHCIRKERSARNERCGEQVRDTTFEPSGANAADASVARNVWNMQSTGSLAAYAEWVRNATLEPSIVTWVSFVDFS